MRELARRLFLEDAPLKALSLALAIALFVVVRGDKDAATGAYVKVVYTLPPDRVLVSDPIGEVRLGVRGPWSRVSRLDERDIPALQVDLTRVADGDFNLTEDMIKLPAGLRLASISPPSVKVKFEPSVTRSVPVVPVIEGQPAAGFRVGRAETHPHEVKVAGAKSVVEALSRVPLRTVVSDAREALHAEVPLEAPPPHARWIGPTTIAVDVDVVPSLAERTLRGVPVRAVGLARLDGRIDPAAVDVVLRGPAPVLVELSPSSFALVVEAEAEDGRAPGSFAKRVVASGLPSGVGAEVRPDEVTLVTRRRKE